MFLGPTIPRDPLELLNNADGREQSIVSKYYIPVVGAAVGFVSVLVANLATKKPIFSGIQKHIMAAGGIAGVAQLVDNFRVSLLAERDAILCHYIQLHPEDFPPLERKKYKDVVIPWHPVR